ncbi:SWI5-dependent HO expression protein 3 [Spathaspora sp. JA1]|nr:SWI5-dependent HO expression protein 3 [Spathaspora sp. JA1]
MIEPGVSNPVSNTSTKVIDSLHQTIDRLTNELAIVKQSHEELTKKFAIVSQKNDSFVDQLANNKHENDMLSALLKRKERRIVDLEDQYNELSSSNESLNLNNKNLKIRCENLQDSSNVSTAEYERLKISYDALISSQFEYKFHFQQEINKLTSQLEQYKLKNQENFTNLSESLKSNEKDFDTLFDSLSNKRKTIDNIYVNKNNRILTILANLSKVAKLQGQENKQALSETTEVINSLVEKYPDLQDKIEEKEQILVDLDDILGQAQEVLTNDEVHTSFDDDATLVQSPKDAEEGQFKKRNHKNKRNSIRIDSGELTPTSLPKKPPQVNNNVINLPKPDFKSRNSPRNLTHEFENTNNNHQGHRRMSSFDNRRDSYHRHNSGNQENNRHSSGGNQENNRHSSGGNNYNSRRTSSGSSNSSNKQKRRSYYNKRSSGYFEEGITYN